MHGLQTGSSSQKPNASGVKSYKFDKIITDQYSQVEVFDHLQIRGLISKVVSGFHATVFAYGQTGSGKTYTMEGYKYEERKQFERAGKVNISGSIGDTGLTVRAIEEIFRQAEIARKEKTVNVYVSFLQIYNEKVFDLLNIEALKGSQKDLKKNQAGLKIRWSKTEQFTVENLFVFRCNDAEHAIKMYNKGVKNKIVASHNLNQVSSRSHALFTVTLEIIDNAAVDNVVTSKL